MYEVTLFLGILFLLLYLFFLCDYYYANFKRGGEVRRKSMKKRDRVVSRGLER